MITIWSSLCELEWRDSET